MTVALAVVAGAAVGIVLGLLGAGGSLLTVPALIFLLALSAHEATGTSLLVVAARRRQASTRPWWSSCAAKR